MIAVSPYTQYKQVIVNSSTKEDLVIMAYEGAIKFLDISLEYFDKNDLEKINNYILKAAAIISELSTSLNLEFMNI
jgi:flagellar protein FliS